MENKLNLPKRERIQFFLSETKRLKKEEMEQFFLEDESTFILGHEVGLGDNKKGVYYIAPLQNNEAIVFLCIDTDGSNWDKLFGEMTEAEYKYKKKTWPKYFAFIDNYLYDRAHLPSLFPLEINNKKCICVGQVLYNISPSDYYESDYLVENLGKLIDQTIEALEELGEKEMSWLDEIGMATENLFSEVMPYFKAKRITDFLIGF